MGLFYHQFFTVRDDAFIYPSEQYYIDVRDFAEASISALEIREAGGEHQVSPIACLPVREDICC